MKSFPVPTEIKAGDVHRALATIGIDSTNMQSISFLPGGVYIQFVEPHLVSDTNRIATSRIFIPVVR